MITKVFNKEEQRDTTLYLLFVDGRFFGYSEKKMLYSFASYDRLSLVITKLSFIWLGSTTVDIFTALIN